MKEIEVKARLENKEEVMQNLRDRGCVFSDPIIQNDKVFVKNTGSPEQYDANDVYLRIRVKNNAKTIFTLKKPGSNDLDCTEHETEIASGEQMEQAILLMGYQKALHIDKTRITTKYDGSEICIDEVEGLGSFIEMETIAADGNAEEIQNTMFSFLETVGVKKENRVLVGYDTLLIEKAYGK
jgi:adenylate cyclase class 2